VAKRAEGVALPLIREGYRSRKNVAGTRVSGQFVSAMVPVTLLTMVDRRRVRTFIDERDIAKVCLRQRARITADGIPSIQTEGTVDNIGIDIVENAIANNPSRQFRQLVLTLPESAQDLPIGVRVRSICAVWFAFLFSALAYPKGIWNDSSALPRGSGLKRLNLERRPTERKYGPPHRYFRISQSTKA
jgi:hypothetical protein